MLRKDAYGWMDACVHACMHMHSPYPFVLTHWLFSSLYALYALYPSQVGRLQSEKARCGRVRHEEQNLRDTVSAGEVVCVFRPSLRPSVRAYLVTVDVCRLGMRCRMDMRCCIDI